MTTRRNFFASAAATGTGLAMAAPAAKDGEPAGGLKLGIASYSLREFSRAYTLRAAKQMKTTYVNFKEFHLPYRSSPDEIAKARAEITKAGVQIMGGGTITLQKEDDADIKSYFEYAKAAGMPLMVIAPTAKTVPMIEKFAKQYDIKVAIHNHGPEDKHFPTPESVLKAVHGMDPRMGLCIDVGHTARTGTDPVAAIRAAGPRLLDMHIKDLKDMMNKDSQVEVGDGAMPVVAIFKELKKMNYQGGVMLEYEIKADDPLPGMMKSFAYIRGVLAGLNG